MRILLILFAAALAACATAQGPHETLAAPAPQPQAEADAEAPIVLLVGLDGLRWDAIDRFPAPTISALAERGVRAQGLIPVMPSYTFTNFYSIATGLYADRHGMIGNRPYDRTLDETFGRESPADARWWLGEPIWVTAESQGVRTATLFWLGSEAPHDGVQASDWRPYWHEMPREDRVELVLEWLARPEETRPRFITVYFDHVDSALHRHGPDTPEEAEAIAQVDESLSQIMAGIEELGLSHRVNVIIVSDHGMSATPRGQEIDLSQFHDFEGLYSPDYDIQRGFAHRPFAQFFGDEAAVEWAYRALALAHPNLLVWRRHELPERFRMNHPARGPDLLLLADPGWQMFIPGLPARWPPGLGAHGYDNELREMHGTLILSGPEFRSGETIAPVRNVHLYPLMAEILGIEPADTDGELSALCRTLVRGCRD